MTAFRAILVSKSDTGQKAEIVQLHDADLMDGDVTIRVEHSSLNYKDGLAVTGKGPIIRRWPLIPGVDLAGEVITSAHPRYKQGDKVVLGGWGVGESHHGGFAERAKVKGDWLVPLPSGLTTDEAMAIGVAGYTAMLCVMALEAQGVTPASGNIIVTGAAGGVGSVAIVLLSQLGFHVVASTGRLEEAAYLKSLGAADVIDRAEFDAPPPPLAKARWAGGIDNVGSRTLANILAQTKENGVITAVGLAQGMDLPTSVAPFILRGVRLVGINSVTTPYEKRLAVWERLASTLDRSKLRALTTHIRLDDVLQASADIVDGKIRGRVVVDI